MSDDINERGITPGRGTIATSGAIDYPKILPRRRRTKYSDGQSTKVSRRATHKSIATGDAQKYHNDIQKIHEGLQEVSHRYCRYCEAVVFDLNSTE